MIKKPYAVDDVVAVQTYYAVYPFVWAYYEIDKTVWTCIHRKGISRKCTFLKMETSQNHDLLNMQIVLSGNYPEGFVG